MDTDKSIPILVRIMDKPQILPVLAACELGFNIADCFTK